MKARLELVVVFNALSSFEYFEMQNYCQNEPNFNSFYLRNSLPKIKDGAICNTLDEYEVIGNN